MFKKIMVACVLTIHCLLLTSQHPQSPIMRAPSVPTLSCLDGKRMGGLTVIAGPMACGKSDELMRQVAVLRVAESKILVCKPKLDTRSDTYLTSRRASNTSIAATLIDKPLEILALVDKDPVDYVAIDEAQFLSKEIEEVVPELIKRGIQVIASGLDKSFTGEPFGSMPYLCAAADQCIKLTAVCKVCRKLNATMTQRLINGGPAHKTDPLIMVDDGSKKEVTYEPRCRACHQIPD
jgi:thymidine kinase